MTEFGRYIKQVREEKRMTLNQVALYSEISAAQLSRIENGKRGVPKPSTIEKISQALKVDYNELMRVAGYIEKDNSDLPKLTKKDERDVAKDLEKIISGLEGHNNGYAQFDGQTIEDMDDEDRELLIASLEQSMRLAKRLAKKKFTPKKYRDKE
ncbi:helix-turn-helix domain-containing protein [Rummeliibacillus sp. POC4]|uniref:helix-turn-helix domain-containing protein n=1 Tax=Rummeliibacillus sp. POC4 TaxID=2305899 RepID=UPI000E667B15|nr:helix-turn-helix transcriptional regulator [Rummeliibacillus sp. POC4]RIJ64123.1 XRE family transcriptional regulator [Rummeliibacillus sp. POC4]